MNFHKYMVLIIGCGAAGLITIGACFMLYQNISEHRKVSIEYGASVKKLDTLEKRVVYPSEINLYQARSNLIELASTYSNIIEQLRAGQIQDLSNAVEFAPLVEEVVKKLHEGAKAAAVSIPQDFAFGFDSYKKGTRPSASAVPRLAVQLRTTEMLCRILYAARVSNIVAIIREEFDDGTGTAVNTPIGAGGGSLFGGGRVETRNSPPSRGIPTDMPMASSNEIYNTERFYIEFAGRENSIWEVFNSLAKGPPLAVVRRVEIKSSTPLFGGVGMRSLPVIGSSDLAIYGEGFGRSGPAPSLGISTNSLAYVERDDRVLAGREPVHAALVVDVIRFAEFQAGAP